MSHNKCDNFGDFFVYRLQNIMTRSTTTEQQRKFLKQVIDQNEEIIKGEFNFYLDAKLKSKEETKKRGIISALIEGWRPVMMYLFMYIIGQYYIINPIIEFFWPVIQLKELPSEMWTLLTVAVGGYITSRGVEKGIQIWKQNTQQQVIVPGEYPMGPGGPGYQDPNQGFGNPGFQDFSDASQGGDMTEDEEIMPTQPQQGGAKEEDLV